MPRHVDHVLSESVYGSKDVHNFHEEQLANEITWTWTRRSGQRVGAEELDDLVTLRRAAPRAVAELRLEVALAACTRRHSNQPNTLRGECQGAFVPSRPY